MAISSIATALGGFGLSAGVATFTATVIQGALVGAALGGISAAVMGGDIGKGILYGAVGGAVMGGISGWGSLGTELGSASTVTGGGVTATADAGRFVVTGPGGEVLGTAGSVTAPGGGTILPTGAKSGVSALSGTLSKEFLAESALGLGGQVLQGMGAEGQAEMQAEEAAKNREHEMAMLEKKLASAERQSGSGSGSADLGHRLAYKARMAELTENRRQYDTARADVEEGRKRAGSALASARAARKGTLKGTPPSIEEQVFQQSEEFYQAPVETETAYG